MTDTPMTSQLMTPLYASAAMRAIMSDRARLQRMLDFEAALARAEAALGVISATGAAAINEACDATLYDIAALVAAQAPSGNIAIAVVQALTRAVAARDPTAANVVHWGATSQDVIDTALMLELRAAIARSRARLRRVRTDGGASRPAATRGALAYPPRSLGRSGGLLRHPCRHLRQDRPRR